jgi:hypothetical protein
MVLSDAVMKGPRFRSIGDFGADIPAFSAAAQGGS